MPLDASFVAGCVPMDVALFDHGPGGGIVFDKHFHTFKVPRRGSEVERGIEFRQRQDTHIRTMLQE